MAQGKLSPRQKMINMMYLVLTALLALNVSKEIINAFVTVNESLEISKANIVAKNNNTYQAFAAAMQNDAKKYSEVNEKAQATKKASDGLVTFIEELKNELVKKAEGLKGNEKVPELRAIEQKENYDVPTHELCGEANDGKGAKATELKNKIEAYKTEIIRILPTEIQADFKKRLDDLLNTKDPEPSSIEYKEDNKRTWEMAKFYHNPVVATAALLTKFQGDVRNSEAQIIDFLYQSVDSKIVKLDKLEAKVIPNSTVVTIGSDYSADVFLSATSSTMDPEVFIGATTNEARTECKGCEGTKLPVDAATRMAKYTDHPGSEGEKKWSGVIRIKQPDNSYKYYPFEQAYNAQKPASVVAAEKMNVLFIGLDNPVSISVPGVPTNKIKPSPEGAGFTLTPDAKAGAGHYIANVTSASTQVSVNVTAELNGKQTPMGKFPFRVKSVPNPVATMGGKAEGGTINKNLLLASSMIPVLKDFYFDLYWQITEFKMSITGKGVEYSEFPGKGNQLDDKMKTAIGKARSGTKVYFEYIKAHMVNTKDASSRQLSPMTFVIQ